MKKKAQGISITVIIIAAIALVVLVVLVAIFAGRLGIFGKKVTEVTEANCAETCFTNELGAKVYGTVVTGTECGDGKHQIYGVYEDVGAGQLCCVDDTIDVDECE